MEKFAMIVGSAIMGFGASYLVHDPSYDLEKAENTIQYYLDDCFASTEDEGKPSAKVVIDIIKDHKAN